MNTHPAIDKWGRKKYNLPDNATVLISVLVDTVKPAGTKRKSWSSTPRLTVSELTLKTSTPTWVAFSGKSLTAPYNRCKLFQWRMAKDKHTN